MATQSCPAEHSWMVRLYTGIHRIALPAYNFTFICSLCSWMVRIYTGIHHIPQPAYNFTFSYVHCSLGWYGYIQEYIAYYSQHITFSYVHCSLAWYGYIQEYITYLSQHITLRSHMYTAEALTILQWYI